LITFLEKSGFIGLLHRAITDNPIGYDLSDIDIKRLIRKHPNVQSLKDQLEINKAVKGMIGDRKPPKFVRSWEAFSPNFMGGKRYIGAPSLKSIFGGHELGHWQQNIGAGSVIPERGLNKVLQGKEMLIREADASRRFYAHLSPGMRRKYPLLAHSFDTYYTHRIQLPLLKSRNKLDAVDKLMDSIDILDGDDRRRLVQRDIKKTKFLKSLNRRTAEVKTNREFPGYGVHKRNNYVGKKLLEGRQLAARNKEVLFKNYESLSKEQKNIVRNLNLDYVKRTRRIFGPDVARGVIGDIRKLDRQYANTIGNIGTLGRQHAGTIGHTGVLGRFKKIFKIFGG